MLSKEELEEILYIALKTGGDFAEIFIEEVDATSIVFEEGKIDKIISGIDAGGGVRIISGRESAYAASKDITFNSLAEAAERARASISGTSKKINIELKLQLSNLTFPIKRRPNEVSIEEKINVIERADKVARSYGERIKQVLVRYSDVNQGVTIANSKGIYIEDNRIRTRFFINVIAEKDGILQTGTEGPGGISGFELFEEYPADIISALATERAIMMLDAPLAPTGLLPVILSSEAGGTMIHEACGHALEADFIMKGTSIFANKIGEKVASSLITVVDDATLPKNFGSMRFDDEGTEGGRTILIEDGILKGFLSDYFTSKVLQIKPTGNGRRESFRTKPNPRMTNTFIAPGGSSPSEIIDSIKYGLLVKRMGGGEVNVTNGDFVFEVQESYLIENGKIKHPVRGAMLTGNGPRVLEIIDMIGSDLTFKPGVCGKEDYVPVSDGQPTIRVPELIVGGRI